VTFHRFGQKAFLAALAVFVAFVVGVAGYNSLSRKSLFDATGTTEAALGAPERAAVTESTALKLQEFKRVEIRDGKKVWEVTAKQAQYYAEQQIAHVNDAQVVIHREDGNTVRFVSDAGKLFLAGETLIRAEMEGEITVSLDESVTLNTDFAIYDSLSNKILVPGMVHISGERYEIEGEGMEVEVPSKRMKLLSKVSSVFESGAGQGATLPGVKES